MLIVMAYILMLLWVVWLVIFAYLMPRNDKVALFRISLIDMSYKYEIRRLTESGTERTTKNAFDWFANKYSYNRFLYSLKPLKLEAWFTEEELKEINR